MYPKAHKPHNIEDREEHTKNMFCKFFHRYKSKNYMYICKIY